MTNIIFLNQATIKINGFKYFQVRTKDVSKLEKFNDRGTSWEEYVTRPERYTVEVSGNSYYDYKEKCIKTVSINSYLNTLNEKSTTSQINIGIKALEAHIAYLEAEIKKVVEDEMYSYKYKEELAAKVVLDQQKAQEYIEKLNNFKNNKGRKAELTKLRKTLREAVAEVEAYIVEKWKYNDNYITMTERTLLGKYPELKIEFTQTRYENVATLVDVNGELKTKTVKGRL